MTTRSPDAVSVDVPPEWRATLSNGIELVFEPMPWLTTVSTTILVPLGSSTDPDGHDGAASVLLEWTQRGSAGRSSRDYTDALDDLGVRRGFSSGREMSTLRASALADVFPEALALLASSLIEPELSDAQFEPARALAREELASLDDHPSQRLFEALRGRFFTSGHRRSVYGSTDGLAALDADGLRRDAARRLGAEGTIVAVAGGLEWDAVRDAVEAAFGGWGGASVPIPDAAVREPFREHIEAPSNQVQIGLAYESLAADDPDWYAQTLAMEVLSGGMGSRLFAEVREKRGLVYTVAASVRTLHRFGYTLGYAGTTPERAGETLEVMVAEIDRLREGVEADELERARKGIVSDLVMQGESSGARAAALARDLFLRGDVRPLAAVRAAIEATSLEEVNGYLSRVPRVRPRIVTLGPVSTADVAATGTGGGSGSNPDATPAPAPTVPPADASAARTEG